MNDIKKKKSNKIFYIVIVLLVIGIILALVLKPSNTKAYNTVKVERDNINITVSGTGALKASDSRKEYSKVSTTVDKVFYKEGDYVKTGDIIAQLDNEDYLITVKSQEIALKQAQNNIDNIEQQINNLSIIANQTGYIDGLTIDANSYVSTSMNVCNVLMDNNYEIVLQFIYNANNKINVGDNALICLVESFKYLPGIVTNVSDKIYVTNEGSRVVEVTIACTNKEYLLDNMRANATVISNNKELISFNETIFDKTENSIVKSEVNGFIKDVLVKNGSYVEKGDVIAIVRNTDLEANYENAKLVYQNVYTQLTYMKDKLEDYKIIAKIDGTITMFDLKEGDAISAGMQLITISNDKVLEFEVPIDELDISYLSYDNKVEISIDALPDTLNNPLEGKIIKLPLEGYTQSGVTDYYVTIQINKIDGIILSMNADADIIIANKENVLKVPVEAIQMVNKEPFVEIVKKDNTTDLVKVITGISSITYTEIIEGLYEGQVIVVPTLSSGFSFMMGGFE